MNSEVLPTSSPPSSVRPPDGRPPSSHSGQQLRVVNMFRKEEIKNDIYIFLRTLRDTV